jgi:DNA polymerase I-like protein with 3'-5' exonuclease and polymerase domains
MKTPSVITIDFETKPILPRPHYPPEPVGVSIKYPGKAPKYYAWGHPCENDCTFVEAHAVLMNAWEEAACLLFHNGKFDYDVATTFFKGLKPLPWERIHDTLYLLFLADPHAASFSLKPAAEKLLGMPPEEQDAVRQWLIDQKIVTKNDKKWGAHIADAPGKLVGEYAKGDVIRTELLFKKLYPEIATRGMLRAYDVERELMPILLENERQGVCVNLKQLEKDYALYTDALDRVDRFCRRVLGSPSTLNLDSDQELAAALEKADAITEWKYTAPSKRFPDGQRSVSKDNLKPAQFRNKNLAAALGYRTRLMTCMNTFMLPWLTVARETGGVVHTSWNQVRQYGDSASGFKGARTGRLSSSPNFQNIPKDFYDKADGYAHPKIKDLPELPYMRNYFMPDKGQVWLKRDYNQQELRILAHFEDGALQAAYNENPRIDMHNFVQGRIRAIAHREYERRKVKILNFGMIYGQGYGALASSMDCAVEEARDLKGAHRKALPDVATLEKDIKSQGKAQQPIVTWAGREYFVEAPVFKNGRQQTFEYKLLNYLVQGSAADATKQSIINYHRAKKHGRFLVTVHDENNISVPKEHAASEMKILREAMDSVKFDVPMLSDGEIGSSWGKLKDYKEAV